MKKIVREIGFWANNKRMTRIHMVIDGRPACHSVIKDDLKFQFVSDPDDYGIINCAKCKKKLSYK